MTRPLCTALLWSRSIFKRLVEQPSSREIVIFVSEFLPNVCNAKDDRIHNANHQILSCQRQNSFIHFQWTWECSGLQWKLYNLTRLEPSKYQVWKNPKYYSTTSFSISKDAINTTALSDPFSNANEPQDIFRRSLECTRSWEIIIVVLIHASILAKCSIRKSHKCEEGEVPKEGCPNILNGYDRRLIVVCFRQWQRTRTYNLLYAIITPNPSHDMTFSQLDFFKSLWNCCELFV